MSEVTTPVSSTPAPESAEKAPENTPKAGGNAAPAPQSGVPTAASVTGGKIGGEKKPESDGTDKAAVAEAKEEARKEAERRLKLKINGQEREYTEAEVIRRAQMAESADEKFKKASEMQRQAEQFIEALKTNPLAILTHPEMGINFREIAEQYLGEHVRKEMMDPVERELEELREFKRQQEEGRRQLEEEQMTAQQRAEQEKLRQQTAQYYDRKITEVLKATNLPKTPNTIKRVAEVLKNAVNNGYELDVETAVDLVNEDYRNDVSSLFGSLEGDALISALGEDLVKKIRTHDIARMKAKLAGSSQPAAVADKAKAPPRRESEGKRQLTEAEWKEQARRRFLGG
jgi:Txe/YoeB family toxin of Txe-Axe toxin-antitoxin module